MTIDEAIEHSKAKAKEQKYYAKFEHNRMMYQSCIKCAEEHEQLAEWLEELKAVRNLDKTNFSDGYNKGIDDCLNIIENCCWKDSEMLVELVKELKGGGSGE